MPGAALEGVGVEDRRCLERHPEAFIERAAAGRAMAEEPPKPLRVKVLWDGVLATTSLIRGFEIRTDKPKGYWGTNTAPAPGEVFVASLASALLQQFVMLARQGRAEVGELTVQAKAPLTIENGGEKIHELTLVLRVWRSAESGAASKERIEELFEQARSSAELLGSVNFPVHATLEVRDP